MQAPGPCAESSPGLRPGNSSHSKAPKRRATLFAMLRALVGLVTLAAVSVVSAAAKPSSGPPRPANAARAVTGFSDTAETVMGTLTAPPSRRFLTRIRNGKMGGVVLLGNGWLTRHTAATVTAELQQAACTRGEPLLIAVDQEGGIVRRLAWAPPTEAPDEMTSPAVAHDPGRRRGGRSPLGRDRRRLRAGRRHAGLGRQLPRLARLLQLPHVERKDWPTPSSAACRRTGSRRPRSTSPASASPAATPTTGGS